MADRPILFSAPMVRAILAGTKTQTRRVGAKMVRHPDLGNLYTLGALVLEHEPRHVIKRACPYGQPGDRLWVRETWGDMALPGYSPVYAYRADPESGEGWAVPPGFRWRPSIHMPRRASRITLEITDVRVERLQDISAADCWAEGIPHSPDVDPVHEFRALWESINGPGSWDANPWLWVLEFRRVEVSHG